MAKPIIMQSMSPRDSFFIMPKIMVKFELGRPQWGEPNTCGYEIELENIAVLLKISKISNIFNLHREP